MLSPPFPVYRLPTNNLCSSSPTMARCSAAKQVGDPHTNFMAPGYPDAQVGYGPEGLASSWADELPPPAAQQISAAK